MNTFLFYDLETSGLNKTFDQVLQFAAIRTDLELNEIERCEILVQLSPDIIPSPGAILTHQISVSETLQQGIPEIDAIRQIHQLLNQPGTISIGYNTLGFDDEFLRFSFYRNLLSPYTHQYANQCGRADLFPMLLTYFLFKNDILIWPKQEEKSSFKLEHINQVNQFVAGQSHNALVDVAVTVELAKRLRREKSMWDYLLGYFDKNEVAKRTLKFSTVELDNQLYRESLLINHTLGYKQHYQCPVLSLGPHKYYGNKTLWLRLDKSELTQTNSETIANTTRCFYKKPCEDGFLLPMVEPYTQYLSSERQTIITNNKQWLLQNPNLFKQITSYHQNFIYPKIPNIDANAALYESGFLSDVENYLCEKFHQVKHAEKYAVVKRFANPSLYEVGMRILGRHYPDCLPDNAIETYESYLKRINSENFEDALVDYRGDKRLTPKKALEEIAQLRNNQKLDAKQLYLLNDLEQYLQQRFLFRSHLNSGIFGISSFVT